MRRIEPPDRTARSHVGRLRSVLQHWEDSGTALLELYDGLAVKAPCDPNSLENGRTYRFLGQWVEHERWGLQFHAATFLEAEPEGRQGVLAYVEKHCQGIGAARAAAIYDAFGRDSVRVLREEPAAVAASVPGISLELAELAAEALAKVAKDEAVKVELWDLFQGLGFPTAKLIPACLSAWKRSAPAVIRGDPWKLLTSRRPAELDAKPIYLPGCGFKRVESLAVGRLGQPAGTPQHQMLALWSWLAEQATGEGHTWQPRHLAEEALRARVGGRTDAETAVAHGLAAGWLAQRRDSGIDFLADDLAAGAERSLAGDVRRVLRGRARWPQERPEGVSDHQWKKLRAVLASPLALLLGTPGTGKTFVAAKLLKLMSGRTGLAKLAVVAPTGKAAVRIKQAMIANGVPLGPDTPVGTIHSLLGYDGDGFAFDRAAMLPYHTLVIDECSMCDVILLACLFRALPDGVNVLLVGDPYQLPPVGCGAPLRDFIAADLPLAELEEIRRNSGLIVETCRELKHGRPPRPAPQLDPEAGVNLRHLEASDTEVTCGHVANVLAAVKARGKLDPAWDVQVLVASNSLRHRLNDELQGLVNPDGQRLAGNPFHVGDKIVCLKNENYSAMHALGDPFSEDFTDFQPAGQGVESRIFNGEIGRVLTLGEREFVALFTEPGRLVRVRIGKDADGDGSGGGANADPENARKGRRCSFDLAYAITCHKFQGSQAPIVVVVLDPSAARMISFEWVYTAISRASWYCVTVGSLDVLRRAATKRTLHRRKTFLKELILEGRNP